MKLNLACGRAKIPGWLNIDISPEVKPDLVLNLLVFPWQIFAEDVEEIYCSHFIEHIGDEFIPFMDEAYRVLKPGGIFRIRAPYYSSIRAWQDPTHKRAISEATFHYFNAKERERMGVGHYPIKSDFDIQELRLHFPEEMQHLAEEDRKYLLAHAINTAADVEVLLRKRDSSEQSVDRQADPLVSH